MTLAYSNASTLIIQRLRRLDARVKVGLKTHIDIGRALDCLVEDPDSATDEDVLARFVARWLGHDYDRLYEDGSELIDHRRGLRVSDRTPYRSQCREVAREVLMLLHNRTTVSEGTVERITTAPPESGRRSARNPG